MYKKLTFSLCVLAALLFIPSVFADCVKVTSDSTPGFCSNFEQASECQCASLGSDQCGDMETIYKNLIGNFGPDPEQAINAGCSLGETFGWATKQDCIDQWHCYIRGGVDSKGEQCYGNGDNGAGKNCQALTPPRYKLCAK